MLNKTIKILTFLLLFLFSNSIVNAQHTYSFSESWGIGANFGLNYFYGDVNDNTGRIWNNTPLSGFYYTDKNIMGGLTFSKSFNNIWGIRSNFTIGNLSGSNEKTLMNFKATVYTFDMDASFQFIDYFLKRPETTKFKYYVFAGIGSCVYHSIRRDTKTNHFLGGIGYDLKGNSTGYTTSMYEKIGLGIAYQLNKKWLFNFETSLKFINTDYLDSYYSSSSKLEGIGYMSFGFIYKFDLNLNFNSMHKSNKLWDKSKGSNNRTSNSGLNNKKKRKLHNKWKR